MLALPALPVKDGHVIRVVVCVTDECATTQQPLHCLTGSGCVCAVRLAYNAWLPACQQPATCALMDRPGTSHATFEVAVPLDRHSYTLTHTHTHSCRLSLQYQGRCRSCVCWRSRMGACAQRFCTDVKGGSATLRTSTVCGQCIRCCGSCCHNRTSCGSRLAMQLQHTWVTSVPQLGGILFHFG